MGAILCNTVGNTLLPVVLFEGKEPARASNFGNGFVGLGFVATPLVIVTLIHDAGLSYGATLAVIGAVLLAFAVVAAAAQYPGVSTGFEFATAVKLLREPIVLVAALALVCYIGLEWSMNTWTRPVMTEIFGGQGDAAAERNAGLVLALFGLSIAVGRFAASAVKNLSRVGPAVIAGMALLAMVAIFGLARTTTPGLGVLAVLVVGLAFAPMFPTIVGVTFAGFDSSRYGSIFGIIFSIGLLGSVVLPNAIGAFSEGRTVQQSLPIAAFMAGVLLILAVVMRLVSRRYGLPQNEQPRTEVSP